MAVAAQTLMDAGMDSVARHEASLTAHAFERLQAVTDLTLYGTGDLTAIDDRVGVIAFNLGSLPHALVAAILGYEAGIGVRSGCFCAQSYVAHLLGRAAGRPDRWQPRDLAAQRTERPGMVRLSLGVYNTRDDVDALVDMLERITHTTTAGLPPGGGQRRLPTGRLRRASSVRLSMEPRASRFRFSRQSQSQSVSSHRESLSIFIAGDCDSAGA